MRNADPVTDALERDFDFLRERRWTDPPTRNRSTGPWPALVTLVRWGLAIVPLALVWACARALEFGGGAPRLAALNTAGVVCSIVVLARGQPRAELERRTALTLLGSSTGLALAATPFLLSAVQFSQLLFMALAVLWTPGYGPLGVVLGLVAVAPIAILAITVWDALQTLRRIRVAPLTWRDSGWLYLGLFPGACAGLLAFRAYVLFDRAG